MERYYKQKEILTGDVINCYWCEGEIPEGETYVGVAEKLNGKAQYRRECPECNKMLLELSVTGEYGYMSYYEGINRELIKRYLRVIRCKGCISCETHEEEGFEINCKRRVNEDEA